MIDTLNPLGITDLAMPLTNQQLWHAIRGAEKEST